MNMGKRQLVLAALIVALGAAVYLNWQFYGNNTTLATDVAATSSSTRTLGEAQLVEGSAVSGNPKSASSSASSAVQTSADTYFTQAQLSRKQVRDSAVDMVEKIINDSNTGEAAKKEAVDKAAAIAQNSIQENNIETLIKAKGFSDCLVFIQNGECSVVVKSKDADQKSAIVIKDIVSGQSGISYDKIKINFV
ncbi:SpoIIIAH-like family protein [Caproiciproducens sp. LBM24188]|nr:SpoIIIAH-like family protein [Oscillospiraceae bacterium]HHV32113.1 SpoIIIAH-like family protein [Clostridiales bacterium]